MTVYLLIPTLIGAASLGWVAGMWTRKRSNHWCPVDGSQLRCLQCLRTSAHVLQPPGERP